MSYVAAIVALCIVIILHEAGHYFAAVWSGMKVDRFSVFGIGPTILKLGTWRGTDFVISAIPFGAFVLIRGMEPDPDADTTTTVDADDLDDDAWEKARVAGRAEEGSVNFRDKPLWARAAVLAGGPVANYLTAIILFFVVFASAGVPGPADRVLLSQVTEDRPAAAAGLEPGDRLLAIGGTELDPTAGTLPVAELIKANEGAPVEITILRDDQTLTKTVQVGDDGTIGVGLVTAGPNREVGVGEAAGMAFVEPWSVTTKQLVGLYKLVTGQISAKVGGPVAIVSHIATSVQTGIISFLTTAAIISTLLGLFNLLPLPALDGGRLTFLGYEALARRRASPRVEELVHGYGMLALLVLIAIITVGDIRSLVG